MATITAVETVVFRLPMRGRLVWGESSEMSILEHVLVRVITDAGAAGSAEAPPRPTIYGETSATIQAVVRDLLAPRILGRDVEDVEGARQALAPIAANAAAKGAVDIALHDAVASLRGVSLAELLGAVSERVEVSYILGLSETPKMIEEARRVFDAGVRVFKVKVDADLVAGTARVEALQSEFAGESVRLYLDANQTLSVELVLEQLERYRDLGVEWVEEPLPVELILRRAELCRHHVLPLIADDSAFTRRDLQREIDLQTFDILNIKPARSGFLESRQMLSAAAAAGRGVMVGSHACSSLGTAHSAAFAALPGVDHPCELSFFLKLDGEIVAAPLDIVDGSIDIAALAAVKVEESRLREFQVGAVESTA